MERFIPKHHVRLTASLFILIALLISGGCAAFNQAPIIDSFTASEEFVDPSGTVHLSTVARDLDNDSLTYGWTASGGNFSGEGPDATWTAPSTPGSYAITVTVSDSKGGKTTSEVYVEVKSVGNNNPPYVRDITYETDCPKGFFHDKETYPFTCVATDVDGDELSYTWECDGGTFSGEGATAYWTAPDEWDTYTISCYATDSKGAKSRTKFISIVVHCACEDPAPE
jgi:hypothetical protein